MSSEPAVQQEGQASRQPGDRQPFLTNRRLLWLMGAALVLAALVFFVADNFVLVEIRLATLRIQARLAWVMIMPLVLGIVLGAVVQALVHERRITMRRRRDAGR